MTGRVQAGLPPFQLPPFSAEVNNRTLNVLEMVAELKAGIIVVPVVAIIANVAIGKAFGEYIGLRISITDKQIFPLTKSSSF